MQAVFRVDASYHIGSGHVMRCLVLADALKKHGWNITFACIPQPGDLISYIIEKKYNVVTLSVPQELQSPQFDGDYKSWLHRDEASDAEDFVSKVELADWVIIDHYAIGVQWETVVKSNLCCKLLSIDDLNREHISNLILDQNLWPDLEHRYCASPSKKLLGPKYALLRPRFEHLRNTNIAKKNQLIAFFGGADPTNECNKLLEAALKIVPLPFKIKVITGKLNQKHENLKQYASEQVEVLQFIEDFEQELSQSRYCIGASGVSNWERFCLNIPSTVVSVADNQVGLSQYLFKQNLVRYLGEGVFTSVSSYMTELEYLKSNWHTINTSSMVEIDGKGADRVVSIMEAS
ncbi:UDP-2,4-diacetamido-2,4,6-trideoxy-beta-L-altropyranose hydrolase [Vibrio mediterranei]|nr:UDP-2,4-diacetamido-2,4,6-trideoxy-beta-L-altropyranose hydrolase [Vibrio mediterranei]